MESVGEESGIRRLMMANNTMNDENKKKALDAAIAKLEKDFGKGAVMKLGDPAAQVHVETVPTGSLSLDLALGVGGVPKGRIIEIYGPESSGKTTVALHMIAEVQKRGGIAGFIDAEHALDPVYAKNIGVDIDELYISQPDSGDQALEITETMVRSGAIDIIVVDSVAALVPKQEIEGDMGDTHVGLQARLMSQALRKLTPVISKSNCVVIFINQLREKVGVNVHRVDELGAVGRDFNDLTFQAVHQRRVFAFGVIHDNIIVCNQKGVSDFALCRETFARAGSTENKAVWIFQLLSVNHNQIIGKGVQAIIQTFFAGLVKFLRGERDEDCGGTGGQSALNLDLAVRQRQRGHKPLFLLIVQPTQIAVMLLCNRAGLKNVVFQFLLGAPGV